MAGRLTVLGDDRLEALRPVIDARLKAEAAMISHGAFEEFFDQTMRAFLVDSIRAAGAHEGTVWLLDETREYLIPRFNSGASAEKIVGQFRQSLRAGMISMVVATEQPICENEVHRDERQDKTLDEQLQLVTCAMLAVPFYFGGELRGVISGVQLRSATGEAGGGCGFTLADLHTFQRAAAVLSRMIEHQLYAMALGMGDFA